MFITIKKNQSDFKNHLMGLQPKGYRAIPVQTLNLGSDDESVTFYCQDVASIAKPGWFKFFISFIKLRSYLLILLPLLFVIVKNFIADRFNDPFSLCFAAVAMLFLYAGVNIRNDVVDHVSGFDRVNVPYTEKPILQGWISAAKSNVWAWIFIMVAFIFSLPVLILQSEETRVLGVVLALVFLGKIFRGSFYKEKHFGELILFLLMGPGIVIGYQVALGAGIDTEVLAFGFMWGTAVLFLLHVNNFCHLLTSSQAQVQNTMTKLGFDRAKIFLQAWWLLYLTEYFVFHWFYSNSFWTSFGTGILFLSSYALFIKISRIRSPLGSDLKQLRKIAYNTFSLMSFILVIEYIWSAGVRINWKM